MNLYKLGPVKFILLTAMEGFHKAGVCLVAKCFILGGAKVMSSESQVSGATIAPPFGSFDPVIGLCVV
jgi:hypothetical protein